MRNKNLSPKFTSWPQQHPKTFCDVHFNIILPFAKEQYFSPSNALMGWMGPKLDAMVKGLSLSGTKPGCVAHSRYMMTFKQ
jgi:hypothetical protein